MKILVVGAAGRTGCTVVQQALAAGRDVTALVHADSGDHAPGVQVRAGDATDPAVLDAAVAGQDAVVTSSIGVGDSTFNAPSSTVELVRTYLRGSTEDKTGMESVVRNSGLDWMITRPAILADEPPPATSASSPRTAVARRTSSRGPTWPRSWSPSSPATSTWAGP